MIKKHKTFDSESESGIAVAPILLKWQNVPNRVCGDLYTTKGSRSITQIYFKIAQLRDQHVRNAPNFLCFDWLTDCAPIQFDFHNDHFAQ